MSTENVNKDGARSSRDVFFRGAANRSFTLLISHSELPNQRRDCQNEAAVKGDSWPVGAVKSEAYGKHKAGVECVPIERFG